MRLADVNEMAEVPEDGIRGALRPGDVAGLYAVHPSDDNWGDGFEPFEAMVVDVPAPGFYMGELRDGSRFEFSERNVAAVRHEMGGAFDWVKRAVKGLMPPTPGMLPALPPEPAPPRLPSQVRPSESKPPAPSFFDWFKPKTTLPAVRPEEAALPTVPAAPGKKKPGIFDWLKPKPYEGPRDVAIAPETEIAPPTKVPKMFATIDETPTIIAKFKEAASAMTAAPPAGPLVATPEMFKHIQATPEEEVDLAKAQQLQLWTTLFPEPSEGRAPDVPLSEMFKPFAAEEIPATPGTPAAAAAPPREEFLPPVEPENLKFLPLPARNELLPTPLDMARGFMTRYEPIEQLWELLRFVRQDPSFQKEVQKGLDGRGAGARYNFETIGMCEGNPDAFEGLASFLGVPWSEVIERGRPMEGLDERGNEVVRLTDYTRINEDIVFPATELIYQAFELIKPKDLPGFFMLEWGGHRDHSCQLVISYAEGSPLTPEPTAAEGDAAGVPVETQQRTLGEIVPEAAMPEITIVMNQLLGREIDELEAIRRLNFVLEPYKEELNAKQVVPSFLSIWLVSSAKGISGQ